MKVSVPPNLENAYKLLHNQVLEVLNYSGYRILDFSKIFKYASNKNKGKMIVTEQQKELMNSQKQWQQVE